MRITMKLRLNCLPLEDRTVPATFVVDSLADVDDGNDAAGQFTLREALVRANLTTEEDTIRFSPSIMEPGGSRILLTAELPVTQPVKIIGPGATLLSLSGQKTSKILDVQGVSGSRINVTVEGLRFLDGLNPVSGGAIDAEFANLNVNDCWFMSNVAVEHGGAIFETGSIVTVQRSAFIGNAATRGGAIYSETTLRLSNSTLADNTVTKSGGALYLGEDISNGFNYIKNCTIVNNFADTDLDGEGVGGGILARAIFIPVAGGGFAIATYINNSIVYDNQVGGVFDDIFSNAVGVGHSLFRTAGSTPYIKNGVNGNIVGINPLVGVRALNGGQTPTYAPQQNSPLLGAGEGGSNRVDFDQRGTPRDPKAPTIGAYEAEHPLGVSSGPTSFNDLYSPKPSASANEAFLKGLYQATLGRAPDAAGLSGWLTAMANGANRRTVANGFVNSIENRTKQVTGFYKYFLGRAPDSAGLRFWVDSLHSGTHESVVISKFTTSKEFTNGAGSNSDFVSRLYTILLNRQADAGGLSGWLAQMDHGMSRVVVSNSILNSIESFNRVMGSYYVGYLQRMPSSAELDATYYTLGTTTFGGLAMNVLASQEFYNNAAANI
jgi:predicted outer membrane repeat protein